MTHISEEIIWKQDIKRRPYPEALDYMKHLASAIREGTAHQCVWLTEHPPLFTAGTSAKKEDLINPKNLPIYEAGRGGQWTYHGPGQRLAYVMLDLTKTHGIVPPRDLRAYVKGLEAWLIKALSYLGVDSFTRDDRIGVWCIDPHTGQEAKIAALGIRISRWVSWHGVSLNVTPNLDDFSGIIPCGIRDYGVTSLAQFNPFITMDDADRALRRSWNHIFYPTEPMKTD